MIIPFSIIYQSGDSYTTFKKKNELDFFYCHPHQVNLFLDFSKSKKKITYTRMPIKTSIIPFAKCTLALFGVAIQYKKTAPKDELDIKEETEDRDDPLL